MGDEDNHWHRGCLRALEQFLILQTPWDEHNYYSCSLSGLNIFHTTTQCLWLHSMSKVGKKKEKAVVFIQALSK